MIIAWQSLNFGPKTRARATGSEEVTKVKQFKNTNACKNPTAAKRASEYQVSEAERLVASGHGGEIRGEYRSLQSAEEAALDPAPRKARPKESMKEEEYFVQKAFDVYAVLVIISAPMPHSICYQLM